MTFSQYSKFFLKELIKNKLSILKVFFTIFISLFIFSSVIILKNNIENEIRKNSKVFLGGDFEISTKNKELNKNYLEILKNNFSISEMIEFTTILRTNNKQNKTTRIKIIDKFYPLIGQIEVEPINALKRLKMEPETILIDETMQKSLDLKLGDKIKIQNVSFKVIGVIKSLPDISGMFVFGDKALINRSSLKKLSINNLGSFINFKYKIISKEIGNKIPGNIINDKNLTIKYPEEMNRNLKKNIENFIYFLSIISASSLLISGIGLKNSLFSYLSTNKLKITIYKSLGLSSQTIKILYYFQVFIILSISSIIAYVSSLLIISFIDISVLNVLKIELEPIFKINELLLIKGFSFIIFFIFAKPLIESIEKMKVVDLFRNSNTQLNLNYTRKSVLETCIFILIFIISFCLLNVKPKQTAIFFLFVTIISFFYYFLSKIYILLFHKFKKIENLPMKMAIRNLNIYSNLNAIVSVSMGLGITIILFLGIVSYNINKELGGSIPKNAPNYFFIGIQNNELNIFKEQIEKIDIDSNQRIVPMISARIESINNIKPKEIINEENESYWFINGERRISWLKDPPFNNPVTFGKWWDFDDENTLQVSLDQKVADDLNIKIGDLIKFNIYGNTVSGIVANFRNVDYLDLNINFAILFNPKYASKIPHEFISTVKFENEEQVDLTDLLNTLPNITYIKLSEYLTKTKTFLNKLFIVCILISSVVILIGITVISSSVNVIGNLKIYQNLVLRILGLDKLDIFKLIVFESIILFIPIILFSLIFSNLFSYILIQHFFNINWHFSFSILLLISSLFLLLLVLTFLISNRKYLNLNLYSLLRNE